MTEVPANPDPVKSVLPSPFRRIALSLSGGGFRAASYSLGAMSYLHQLRKSDGSGTYLDNVCFVSSTSGGTFPAALYSKYIREGKNFPMVYKDLMNLMGEQDLLGKALSILNDDKAWEGGVKQRNMINAFAKAYDELLFKKGNFSIFDEPPGQGQCAVCFNSTDFYKGMSFRFQSDSNNMHHVKLGSEYLYLDKANNRAYRKIKLADILAASSCFPAGFEPIDFPHDFTYNDSPDHQLNLDELNDSMLIAEYDETKQWLPKNQRVGFMDGGITDNQGLYSSMLADNREKPYAFDLILVSDVTSYFMDPYEPVPVLEEPEWRKRNFSYYLDKFGLYMRRIRIGWMASILILLACLITIAATPNIYLRDSAFLLGGIFFTISAIIAVLLFYLNRSSVIRLFFKRQLPSDDITELLNQLKLNNNFSKETIARLSAYLTDTRIGSIEQMIKARGASLITLSMDVNLKNTRRLIYEMFYDNCKFNNRRMFNVIYELSTFNRSNRQYRFDHKLNWNARTEDRALLLEGVDRLNPIAEDARNMGTTLWFDQQNKKDEMLKKIVATGQFTTCANTLEYILSLLREVEDGRLEIPSDKLAEIQELGKKVTEDWIRFKKDPYFLLEKYSMV